MSRRAALGVAAGYAGILAVHALVGRASHAEHVLHAVAGAAYLAPIVAAATWLGPRAGIAVALASSAASVLHGGALGAPSPMGTLDALVLSAVYLFVGVASAALAGAAERERRTRLEAERRAQLEALVQALAALSGALRERDDGTAAHCERVAEVADRVAAELGLPEERRRVLRLAARVHDIGKLGVRDDVLLKPGALTPGERERMERHPAIAAALLEPIRGVEEIAEVVLSHHECPDGSGYPRRLRAAEIPRLAAVLRVADVYAALEEARPYKAGLAPAEALDRMRALGGKLDGAALAALARCVSPPPTPHP